MAHATVNIEDKICIADKQTLELLLLDHTTNKHIVWATNDYRDFGESFSPECEITVEQITGAFSSLIRPRVTKAREKQSNRTRDKAEVFTPSWVCNLQNNLIDEQWFGRPDVFNSAEDQKWKAAKGKIVFPEKSGHDWQDYVMAKRMEIACGEAPYLVSRYDTVTGEPIEDVTERIGLLDRKMRIVNENTHDEKDWMKWVKKAYQSTYGFEYQGDNLLLARENLLFTFVDNMAYKFGREPDARALRQIAGIISWNIWQMDGMTLTAPYSEAEQEVQYTFFDTAGFDKLAELSDKIAVPCIIRDWTKKSPVEYRTLMK